MIIGTAGHIDHGKTTLVRALTGVDTDRLPEEKKRGISIELGYAFLDTPAGQRMGFIDVPGHERLVHTMVAGASGIDFALLLVAADDGPMPQTLEHLAVLKKHAVDYDLAWTLGGLPFLTEPGDLVTAVQSAIRAETGLETELSTTGGTSDGRFIAQICPQVIELGPPNASIHKIDEHIALADIEPLTNIYRRVLERLATA